MAHELGHNMRVWHAADDFDNDGDQVNGILNFLCPPARPPARLRGRMKRMRKGGGGGVDLRSVLAMHTGAGVRRPQLYHGFRLQFPLFQRLPPVCSFGAFLIAPDLL